MAENTPNTDKTPDTPLGGSSNLSFHTRRVVAEGNVKGRWAGFRARRRARIAEYNEKQALRYAKKAGAATDAAGKLRAEQAELARRADAARQLELVEQQAASERRAAQIAELARFDAVSRTLKAKHSVESTAAAIKIEQAERALVEARQAAEAVEQEHAQANLHHQEAKASTRIDHRTANKAAADALKRDVTKIVREGKGPWKHVGGGRGL